VGSTSLISPTCLGNYPCWLDILIRIHGLESMASMSSAWVSEPDGRGTWGLIQTCLLTLFLCIYSAVHLNIQPHQKSKTIIPSTDRCFNTCRAVPEYMFVSAVFQWNLTNAPRWVKVVRSPFLAVLGTTAYGDIVLVSSVVASKLYFPVEAFLSLRDPAPRTYETVKWIPYWPHL